MLAREMKTAGFRTILIWNLCSVAGAEGPNGIQGSPGQFHHPLGNPTLSIEEERRWHLWLTRAALATLQRMVDKADAF
jgi:hypothetical protein